MRALLDQDQDDEKEIYRTIYSISSKQENPEQKKKAIMESAKEQKILGMNH